MAETHKNAEAFLNKSGKGTRTGVARRHLLKAGCNTGGIGYVRKPNRLIALSISSLIDFLVDGTTLIIFAVIAHIRSFVDFIAGVR